MILIHNIITLCKYIMLKLYLLTEQTSNSDYKLIFIGMNQEDSEEIECRCSLCYSTSYILYYLIIIPLLFFVKQLTLQKILLYEKNDNV